MPLYALNIPYCRPEWTTFTQALGQGRLVALRLVENPDSWDEIPERAIWLAERSDGLDEDAWDALCAAIATERLHYPDEVETEAKRLWILRWHGEEAAECGGIEPQGEDWERNAESYREQARAALSADPMERPDSCPFCGQAQRDEPEFHYHGSGSFEVICGACGASGPPGQGFHKRDYATARKDAVRRWNRRQPVPKDARA